MGCSSNYDRENTVPDSSFPTKDKDLKSKITRLANRIDWEQCVALFFVYINQFKEKRSIDKFFQTCVKYMCR